MDALYTQFEEIQSEIDILVDENELAVHSAARTEFEDLFYANIALAQEILNANKPVKNDDNSSSASYVSGDAGEQAHTNHKVVHTSTRGIKLPTIQIPKFSGQYEEWLEFHDLFVSLIHEHKAISDIQKFHYLRASLEGAAAQFLGQSVNERAESVRRLKLCENCLRPGHQARVCRLGPCMKCSQKHNSVLHSDTASGSSEPSVVGATSHVFVPSGRGVLSTAVIHMYDKDNHRHEVRAFIDNGSMSCFMTDSLLRKLQLKYTEYQTSVTGLNKQVLTHVSRKCNATIESRTSQFKANMTFYVVPEVVALESNVPKLNIPKHVIMADPEYFNPTNIDILLGSEIFWELLEHDQISLGTGYPILHKTKLGYVVGGPTIGLNHKQTNSVKPIQCNLIVDNTVQEQLAKFWSLEEVPDNSKQVYSVEERLCEQNFVENFTRMPDGRFSVAVPLKKPESCLGDSFNRAKQCFLSLERRLDKQPLLKQMYTDFMSEYIDLGHMSETRSDTQTNKKPYFLPHHGILREQSSTTKLRAVFNGSAATSSGVSYNDLQMVGPTIQSDLLSILLRFRHYPYVLTGDIEKMYRQVLVHENQRHLQQIIWRDDPTKELKLYKLNTVTYGTASAPFLAVRCLKQLALECPDSQLAQIISDDFYVDDLVTGAQTKEQLIKIKEGVCKVLSAGCFNLRKIRSNIELSQSDSCQTLNLGDQGSSNTLGLGWSPPDDNLYYSIKQTVEQNPTKRSILSAIGQIYDPLGLLSVCVIQAKIMLQKLWLLKCNWDDPLPSKIVNLWHKFQSELRHVLDLKIPRCVINDDPNSVIEIHTFCDSSQDAYGSCLYVRSECNGQVEINLLCAKSKVAPLKPTTIPRLELCGALVAARLTERVLKSIRIPIKRCILWTDSSIVLGWLQTQPNKLKQFVKNRVAEVQELTANHEWRHVPTATNPADMLSRGVNMSELQDLSMWWNGPDFLKEDESNWPTSNFVKNNIEMPEMVTATAISLDTNHGLIDYKRFSKLLKLKRALAYAMRFIHNCRNNNINKSGPLTTDELKDSFTLLLKWSQKQSFQEYDQLVKRQSLPNKNKLLSLSPFIDDLELIRVGGRLNNSQFPFDKKHPVLLSSKHTLTQLIFNEEHIRLMHAGPQLLLASIKEEFWPIGGRNLARSVAHKCLRCFKLRAQTVSPIMGHLPEQRLNPGYVFQTTGVDYAGPLLAADRKGRGCKLIKVYVVVFVCFTTKCLHLELVTSLTKEAYIAALHRFIARRGKPATIFSDNGTQFVGAKNELNAFLKQNSSSISEFMANEFVDFKFIPAYASHFGGLWEAGVKSFKYHLTRVIGDSHLTFEELYTILVKIEATLNSRPLSPISSDPSDLNPLTPGHFLVGRPLTTLPVPPLENINPTRLQRWDRIEQIHQHFWTRWQKEYVSELQQKTKWRSCKGHLDTGTMVIVKEDAVPPLKWSLGRIVRVHPGIDGVNRVADIQSHRGVIRRAFNRICPLPLDDDPVESRTFNAGGHVKEP
ncbi:uncharacterized protein LOC134677967 [Cydia fagiglandana]|uniref:uncharacterized protein LOC134677967 n=1 Tax=Cydia fagiglandana TaxID=1458189 RepID=UPI002FEE4284